MQPSEIEERFDAAVTVIKNLPTDGSYRPSTAMLLRFYALYKQSTAGPCNAAQPSFLWDPKGYKKWEAWSRLGQLPRHQAMAEYVEDLKKIVETMSLSGPVAEFLDKLGCFYEQVQDDSEAAAASIGDVTQLDSTDSATHSVEPLSPPSAPGAFRPSSAPIDIAEPIDSAGRRRVDCQVDAELLAFASDSEGAEYFDAQSASPPSRNRPTMSGGGGKRLPNGVVLPGAGCDGVDMESIVVVGSEWTRRIDELQTDNSRLSKDVTSLHDTIRKLVHRLDTVERELQSAKLKATTREAADDAALQPRLQLTGDLQADALSLIRYCRSSRYSWLALILWPVVVHLILSALRRRRR